MRRLQPAQPPHPKRTSFSLSPEAHMALRIEALRRGMSMSQLIVLALADAGVDIPAKDLEG